jgi:hypothetical protein
MHPEKIVYGAIIGFLILFVEKTGRKLVALPVIAQAFAAFVFSRARLICAITVQFVCF